MPPNAKSTAVGPPLAEPIRPAAIARAGASVVGLAAVALAAMSVQIDDPAVAAVRVAGVALPVGLGLVRLARTPRDRFALLLVGAGAMWALTTLAESSDSTLYSIGRLSVWLVEPALVFLILAFPYGRLETTTQRRLAAAVAFVVATLYVPSAFLAPFPEPTPWASCGTDCPPNALQLTSEPVSAVGDVIQPMRELLSVVLFAVVAYAVLRRARRSGRLLHRILIPVVGVAAVRVLGLAIYFIARPSGETSSFTEAFGWLYVLSLPGLTLAFAAGLLSHRLFVADVLERLTSTLSSRPTPRQLRTALSDALREPSLDVAYWDPDGPGAGWIGADGQPRAAPLAGAGEAVTELHDGDRRLAAIVHDADLLHDPALLDGVAAYVTASVENRHLVAELRGSLADLTASRARLVTVADDERRKIERDLHDGAQQRLVALQIKLELLAGHLEQESPADAKRIRGLETEIETTLDEVRRFGRGVYPPLLADRGLADALRAVARSAVIPTTVDARLPHRYPRALESAVYFACLEAVQNATKHASGARAISIALSGNGRLRFDVRDDGAGFEPDLVVPGAGLTNVRDRVGSVGGTVNIVSAPGRGTCVTGMIPLG